MELDRLYRRRAVRRARRLVYETDEETLRDLVELTKIPAPSYGEAARGARVAERFRELGLEDVERDEVGNVLASLPAPARSRPAVLVSAHLDTVFPEETDVRVRRDGERLCAPGIGDNGRGLAAMLAVARVLVQAGVQPDRPLVFAATVGEEGLGDLYGVKHLFREGSAWRDAAAFISLDGSGRRRVVHGAIGSRRLRLRIHGPGGHSWADWGTANPVNAMALAIAELGRLELPQSPRTALTVGRIAGGTSVNAIPESAWAELDLRSEDAGALARLEEQTRKLLAAAVEEANASRRPNTEGLAAEVEVIGDRPTGRTPPRSALVRAAQAATRALGEAPELVASSTDANVPMALGIPAIALGAGGESGGTHTLDEWYANRGGPEGVERVLLTVLAVTGVK